MIIEFSTFLRLCLKVSVKMFSPNVSSASDKKN